MHLTSIPLAVPVLLAAVLVSIWPDGSGPLHAAAARQVDKSIQAKAEKPATEQEANTQTQGSPHPGLMENKGYKHSWIDVDGAKTHYIEAGEGDPIVLVHGALPWACGETNYGGVVGLLGKHFHAIAVDMIGYGYTRPRGPQDYPAHAQGDFLIRFIEALDVGPVSINGNSHGGFLVQYVAHERPDLVKRLILTNSLSGTSGHWRFRWSDEESRGPLQSRTEDRIRSMLERYYMHKDLVTEERVKLVHHVYQRNYENFRERSRWISRSYESYNDYLSYKGKHISEWGAELKMPVLLMWSEPGSRVEWGLTHLFKVPGAEMHILPWGSHHLFTDQPDRWVQVVTNWLTNEPARPRNPSRE
jgi:pimeloyl-ACP methyl ester carboxylesterase